MNFNIFDFKNNKWSLLLILWIIHIALFCNIDNDNTLHLYVLPQTSEQ